MTRQPDVKPSALTPPATVPELELSDQDILGAMSEFPTYLDITTEDFRAIHHAACRHARLRMATPDAEPVSFRAQEPPRVAMTQVLLASIGALISIAALAGLNTLLFGNNASTMMIGSFGATAALLFGAPGSPFSQPRNVIGGHVISATVGVLCWRFLGTEPGLAGAVAVASAIALMHVTRTMHPPGGATALIAVIGSGAIHELGFAYVLMPAMIGPLALFAVALVVNNAIGPKRYPEVWF